MTVEERLAAAKAGPQTTDAADLQKRLAAAKAGAGVQNTAPAPAPVGTAAPGVVKPSQTAGTPAPTGGNVSVTDSGTGTSVPAQQAANYQQMLRQYNNTGRKEGRETGQEYRVRQLEESIEANRPNAWDAGIDEGSLRAYQTAKDALPKARENLRRSQLTDDEREIEDLVKKITELKAEGQMKIPGGAGGTGYIRQKDIEPLEKRLEELRGYGTQSVSDRAGNVLRAAGQQWLGGTGQAYGTAIEAVDTADRAIDRKYLEQEISELERSLKDMKWARDTTPDEQEREQLNTQIAEWERRLDERKKQLEQTESGVGYGQNLRAHARGISERGALSAEKAGADLGTAGKWLTQAAISAGQMGIDVVAGGGLGMMPMLVRSFGYGAQEAEDKGYSITKQVELGLANAAIEYFSEKLFGGNPAYDTGAGLLDQLVYKISGNSKLLQVLASAPAEKVYEGLEELVSDVLNPIAEWVLTGNYDPASAEELIDSFATGVLTALVAEGGQQVLQAPARAREAANTREAQRQQSALDQLRTLAEQVRPEGANLAQEAAEAPQNAPAPAAEAAAQAEENVASEATNTAARTIDEMQERIAQTMRAESVQSAEDIRANAQLDFGAKGRQEAAAQYDGGTTPSAYYRAFSAFYRAGVNGAKMNTVPANNAVELSTEQQKAAYNAGKTDAAASLEQEKQGAAKAAVRTGKFTDEANRDYIEERFGAETAERISTMLKATGTDLDLVDMVRPVYNEETGRMEGTAWAEIRGSGVTMEKNAPAPMRHLGHEWTHRAQEMAPEAYRAFRSAVASRDDTGVMATYVWYRENGESVSMEKAMDEYAADVAGRMLNDSVYADRIIERLRSDRTALEKLRDAIQDVYRTVKAYLSGEEARAINQLERKLTKALQDTAKQVEKNRENKTAPAEGESETRYSINPSFASEIQEWYDAGRPDGESFVLGETGAVLQGLGAIENDIYMNGDKITQILDDHPEMSLDVIKRIPEVLDDPVLILKSKNKVASQYGNSRLVMFGSVKAEDGRPVMCVLDLRPTENGFLIDDMQKVTSAYSKDVNPVGFISGSDVLHADMKRTIPLLRGIGFTGPMSLLRNGSIGSITYNGNSVNIQGVPFSQVVDLGAGEQRFSLEDADIYNRTAVLKESTVDKYLKDYASQSSPNYAQAYIVRMSPRDFVRLTASREGQEIIRRQTGELDMEEMQKANVQQPLQLRIDTETGEINGHEGRHRATALSRAGVDSIPVLLFDSGNKYSKTAMDSLTLTGQDFGSSRSNAEVTVSDVQPLSYANRDTVIQKFATQPTTERIAERYGHETARWSLKSDADYMAAVKAGDMDTAQEMVDEAAEAAGYDTLLLHGTSKNFTRFMASGSKTQAKSAFLGIWLSDSERTARAYSTPQETDYVNQEDWDAISRKADAIMEQVDQTVFHKSEPVSDRLFLHSNGYWNLAALGEFFKTYCPEDYEELKKRGVFIEGEKYVPLSQNTYSSNEENLRVWNDVISRQSELLEWYSDLWGSRLHPSKLSEFIKHTLDAGVVRSLADGDIAPRIMKVFVNTSNFAEAQGPYSADEDKVKKILSAKRRGKDGIIFRGMADGGERSTHYVVFDNTKIKSADPVTYDDNGNIIPISERFNPEKEDIRYSLKHPTFTDDEIESNRKSLRSMAPVARLSGNEFAKGEKDLMTQVLEFFDSLGNNVYSERFGDVSLSKSSWRSERRHGMTTAKAITFAAVPDVIKNGAVIDVYNPTGKNGVERIVIAAPVTIGNQPAYVGVMLQRDAKNQRLYLHDVVTENDQGMQPLTQTRPGANGNQVSRGQARLDISSILLNALGVKQDIRNQLKSYDELGEMYGTIPEGEQPFRVSNTPRRTRANDKVSQTVRTILEAEATPDVMLPTIEQMVVDEEFSYTPYSDKAAIANADYTIRRKEFPTALADWTAEVQKGIVNKTNTALGWALYNNAVNSGDTKAAIGILTNIVQHQRNAAQAVQATRILKKLSPETQLYTAQRSVDNLQEEINRRYGKKAPELKISEELAEEYLSAETEKERQEALQNIYRDIGRQMPSTFRDRWNAWRYLAMLGNARTHIRNIVGNAGFVPFVLAKDITATALEGIAYRMSGGKMQRTKANIFNKEGTALYKAAFQDYKRAAEARDSADTKYSDFANANKYIEEGRRVFGRTKNQLWNKTGGAALEGARRGNSRLLEAEDAFFKRQYYALSLAQYAKANGITAEQIRSGKIPAAATEYAYQEALKATYNDTNAFSEAISRLGRTRDDNPASKALGIAMEGVLPFRKTPANILVRGVEYSPLGLLKSLTYDMRQVKRGEMTTAQMLDDLSAGLTGTGIMALGVLLASLGVVRGAGGDDEKKKKMEELEGHQAYSMELPDGTSITLDWLAPESLPFFIGVNLYESTLAQNEKVTMAEILSAVTNVSEPLLEMSCLQSLNDIFDAVGYAKEGDLSALSSAAASAATSYLTQALPTLLGQTERTGESSRMQTFTEKDSFLTGDMQYTLGRASARIPGWDYQQIPYIDAWGREETSGAPLYRAFSNFLNPAFVSKIDESEMEQELLRVYEATGEGGVLPSRPSKYITVDSERKYLTGEEYVMYASQRGQIAYQTVTSLVESKAYQKLSDEEKAEAIKDAYQLADQTAKVSVGGAITQSWVTKAAGARSQGIQTSDYITAKTATSGIEGLKNAKGDTISNSAGLLKMEAIYEALPGLSKKQYETLFEYMGVGKTVIGYSESKVKSELNSMRKQ